MLPPGGALPSASEVGVAEPVSGYLAGAPARVRLVVRLGLRALQLTSFPRRFSHLPLDKRSRHLEKLEGSRHSFLRDLFLLFKTLTGVGYSRDMRVQRVLGVESRCVGTPSPLRLHRGAMQAPDGVERCDVVVVGSGAGGASVARVLSEAGVSVIVVEEGEHYDASTYSRDVFESLPKLYRDSGLTVAEGRPAIPLPVGRCVGGTTVINSGTCFRAPGDILMRWREEFGIDWATELDGEFEAVERALNVTRVVQGAVGRNAELCRIGADALGVSNHGLARNAADVTCCGSCPTGCAIDAKMAMHVSELPRAVAAGASIRAGQRVTRVLVENGRAVGVKCRGGYEVRAKAVVLAAGALGTPELLLRQRLADSSGEVGRHLHIHPACWVGAHYDDPVNGWDGVMQSWAVDEWNDRGLFLEATFSPLSFGGHWLRGAGAPYKARLEQFDHLGVIGVHLSDRSEGRVALSGGGARITYKLTKDDAATLRFGIARAADVHFAAGATEVYPQVGRVSVLKPGEQTPLVEQGRFHPGEMRLEGFHPMGTTRMGRDPRTSVVSPSGETHDVPGLYVADSGLFPTSLRVNPMITVMAVARRVAAGVADGLTPAGAAPRTPARSEAR
ncbi:MAG TPA: GMC family oxidoreductase [Thermoleophilaceae bacterium]